MNNGKKTQVRTNHLIEMLDTHTHTKTKEVEN